MVDGKTAADTAGQGPCSSDADAPDGYEPCSLTDLIALIASLSVLFFVKYSHIPFVFVVAVCHLSFAAF